MGADDPQRALLTRGSPRLWLKPDGWIPAQADVRGSPVSPRRLVFAYLTALLPPRREGADHISKVSDAIIAACR